MRLSIMVGAVLMSTMLCAVPAGAQPVDDQLRATARALADEGMAFYEKKQYADALDRFDRAATIIQAPTITLHAARSLDKLGRLIEAAERYRACINTQLEDKAPDAFKSAQESARSELQALTPRIPSIEIAVQGPGADQAAVTLDGKPVPKALIGVKTLVNPGEHKIGATTETHADLEEVTIVEKQLARVVLELEPKKSEDDGQTTPPGDKATPTPPMSKKKLAGFVTLGVGGAIGIAGIAVGITALNKQGELESQCPNPKIDPVTNEEVPYDANDYCVSNAFKARFDSFQTLNYAGTAMMVIGGAAVTTGIILVVLGSKEKPTPAPGQPATSFHVEPWVGIGSAGLRGTF